MDKFTIGYIQAALWSSTDSDDNDRPLDDNFGLNDLSTELLQQFEADCQEFQDKCRHLWDDVEDGPECTADERAGHDFWLTRNGHGAGFWDRPEIYGQENADKLTDMSKNREVFLWVENGKIYGN